MDTSEIAMRKVAQKIESLEDFLEDALPSTDKKHKDEILDICSLVRMRAEQYMRQYGVNGDAES